MYNPTIGRWMTRDPIGEQGGMNLYAYCDNDPINGTDPTGLWRLEGNLAVAEKGDSLSGLASVIFGSTDGLNLLVSRLDLRHQLNGNLDLVGIGQKIDVAPITEHYWRAIHEIESGLSWERSIVEGDLQFLGPDDPLTKEHQATLNKAFGAVIDTVIRSRHATTLENALFEFVESTDAIIHFVYGGSNIVAEALNVTTIAAPGTKAQGALRNVVLDFRLAEGERVMATGVRAVPYVGTIRFFKFAGQAFGLLASAADVVEMREAGKRGDVPGVVANGALGVTTFASVLFPEAIPAAIIGWAYKAKVEYDIKVLMEKTQSDWRATSEESFRKASIVVSGATENFKNALALFDRFTSVSKPVSPAPTAQDEDFDDELEDYYDRLLGP